MAGETRKKAAAKKKTAKRSAKGAAKAPSRRSEAGTGDRGDWRGSALAPLLRRAGARGACATAGAAPGSSAHERA